MAMMQTTTITRVNAIIRIRYSFSLFIQLIVVVLFLQLFTNNNNNVIVAAFHTVNNSPIIGTSRKSQQDLNKNKNPHSIINIHNSNKYYNNNNNNYNQYKYIYHRYGQNTVLCSSTSNNKQQEQDTEEQKHNRKRDIPNRIVKIYTNYVSKLWKDTNVEARKEIASHRIVRSLKQIQSLIKNSNNDEKDDLKNVSENDRMEFVNACDTILDIIEKKKDNNNIVITNDDNDITTTTKTISTKHDNSVVQKKEKTTKSSKKIINGATNIDTTKTNVEGTATTTPAVTRVEIENDNNNNNNVVSKSLTNKKITKKRKHRSVGFGALMGLVVACWVFSGNYIFTTLFTLMTICGQLEYYRMVINTDIYPARRISIIGACSMFITALFTPDLHQICLPISGLWAMVWFLTMRRQITTIPEIATTFTGMFYLGYVPSFWVRVRMIGMNREPTRLAPIMKPILQFLETKGQHSKLLPSFIPNAVHLPITTGAIFIFWTWLCLAFSDVGAYFVGRKFGNTKLGVVAPAAGATSPNKTVEGVLGGCAVSAVLAIFGAWVQRWPIPIVTGTIHGVLLGLLGLLGDLTASMLKRDAGLKDFGDILPEHGGILDRVDSFIWAAPYSWLVCKYVIPSLKQLLS